MRLAWTVIFALALLSLSLWARADCRPPRAWVDRHEPDRAYDRRIDDLYRIVSEWPRDERAGALAIAYGESRFARHVLFDCIYVPEKASTCSGGNARSYFQLEKSACPELWKRPKGEGSQEALAIAAECARLRWRYARGVCPTLEGAFAKYGGRKCSETRKSTAFKTTWYRRFFEASSTGH